MPHTLTTRARATKTIIFRKKINCFQTNTAFKFSSLRVFCFSFHLISFSFHFFSFFVLILFFYTFWFFCLLIIRKKKKKKNQIELIIKENVYIEKKSNEKKKFNYASMCNSLSFRYVYFYNYYCNLY